MRALPGICVAAGLALPVMALAQGTDTATGGIQSEEEQQTGAVQVGAGSKGDVTTRSSGSKGEVAESVKPVAAGFEIRPRSDAFWGPAPLEIQQPQKLRCDLIEHPSARQRCEAQAARMKGGNP